MKGFKDINIMATDPKKEQFAPTEAQPIRQRARMAGDPVAQGRAAPPRVTAGRRPARSGARRPSSPGLRRY